MTACTTLPPAPATFVAKPEIPASRPCIIRVFALQDTAAMEAEQLNSIANKLEDIAQRAAELRRYL